MHRLRPLRWKPHKESTIEFSSDEIQQEDIGICEAVQRGLQSAHLSDRPLLAQTRERRPSFPLAARRGLPGAKMNYRTQIEQYIREEA